MADTSLRIVAPEDCKDILLWRNDPVTRQMSLSSDVINEEEHFKWFSNMLLDEDHCAIIGENKAKKFGVVFSESKVERYWFQLTLLLSSGEKVYRHGYYQNPFSGI